MTTIAQDAASRADIKEDRKLETAAETKPAESAQHVPAKEPVKKETKPKPASTKAPAKPKTETKPVAKEQAKPKTETKPVAKEPAKKEPVSPVKMPKPLSGAAPIYILFAAKRQDNVADNRRHESLNNLQEQLFLGVSVDKAILETAKANYTKEFPHLYFWISTKKVLGEMPKDLGLALQIENVLIARGKM